MSDFRRVTDEFWASPQIDVDQVSEAASRGFCLIVNNRPEGESIEQTSGREIEQAARSAGLDYCAIPITHAGFAETQVDALVKALARAQGPVLAYCRSGTRSTLLWALAQARLGRDLQTIASDAADAGYDVASIRPLLESLAKRSS